MSTIIPKTPGIYKITCISTNKIYIGSAINLYIRWRDHRVTLRNKMHRNSRLQHAWDKYGETAFTFEIIEFVMPWSLLDREQYWLDKLKPFDRNIGFNINPKAESSLGRKCSPETRAKIGAANKGRERTLATREKLSIAGKGRKHTAKTLQKMSIKGKQRKHTAESIQKMAAAKKGKKHSPETIEKIRANSTGRKHTAEAKAKVSAAKKGIKRSSETIAKMRIGKLKYTYMVTDPQGKDMVVNSLSQFCEEHGLQKTNMYRVAEGKANHHKGWKVRRIK